MALSAEKERMEQIERNLHEAAVQGSVTSLHSLIQEDELILDRYLAGCYAETPLHIAAMLGHLEFTKEILSKKPGLAAELDFRRSSALHLAAGNGHLDVVKALLSVNPEMCLSLDRYGRNPLHIAVIKGRVEVLRELVKAKPEATRVRVDRGETILHLCVRHYQLESLKLLVETINDHEFVNSKDYDNFNVLHLAVADKQIESIKFLIEKTAIEVNALNCNGFTALDMALACSQRSEKDMDIRDSLRSAGAVRAQDLSASSMLTRSTKPTGSSSGTTNQILTQRPKRETHDTHQSQENKWLDSKRNTLMVVASLIATMAFQAGTNPPMGVWQDDGGGNSTSTHIAGTSVMAYKYPIAYTAFLGYNTAGFLASISVILLLISGLPFRCRFFVFTLTVTMWVAIIAVAFTYTVSVAGLIPDDLLKDPTTFDYASLTEILIIEYGLAAVPTIACAALLNFLILGHIIRCIVKMVIFLINLTMWMVRSTTVRKKRREATIPTSSTMMNRATA
ncbi:Ank_2 domain-containing protein/Ank_4 domain-containing protein/PGG domain-containing protein [Cephalotus follicularis]|uniref:Ank_2 domain-containing protein/Ank_4 domain-containing protein/PGG domain-containing protein n=1 Tax=Cephalotus follicularis TaxID=3775 RepID=A0A1Q3DB36_CEPFO|nr:Ank_2 domain-containing protein/Ank_4 domain-containing protein/PGG domain-containing protein [Cephalotus follicularis]